MCSVSHWSEYRMIVWLFLCNNPLIVSTVVSNPLFRIRINLGLQCFRDRQWSAPGVDAHPGHVRNILLAYSHGDHSVGSSLTFWQGGGVHNVFQHVFRDDPLWGVRGESWGQKPNSPFPVSLRLAVWRLINNYITLHCQMYILKLVEQCFERCQWVVFVILFLFMSLTLLHWLSRSLGALQPVQIYLMRKSLGRYKSLCFFLTNCTR